MRVTLTVEDRGYVCSKKCLWLKKYWYAVIHFIPLGGTSGAVGANLGKITNLYEGHPNG